MRFLNSSGVSFLGFGGLDADLDLRAFDAAAFFARDEVAFFVPDEALAERFLLPEL